MTLRVHILPLEGVFDTGLSCLLDAFGLANRLAMGASQSTRFEITVKGVEPEVHTGHGLRLHQSASAPTDPDWIIVPALGGLDAGQLAQRLNLPDVRATLDVLRAGTARGVPVCGTCTSTFLLGDAGLLDGREATTSWWLADSFRARYPAARLDDTRMLIEDGPAITAGASMSHLDLALLAIQRASPTLANQVARYMVIDNRLTLSTVGVTHLPSVSDPVVLRFEAWARQRLSQGFSLADAAREAGASPRTLSRRLKATLGKSPLEFFQDLRVEHAVHMLRTTHASVDQVAAAVGYADAMALRDLLRKKIGHTVASLRANIRMRPTPARGRYSSAAVSQQTG